MCEPTYPAKDVPKNYERRPRTSMEDINLTIMQLLSFASSEAALAWGLLNYYLFKRDNHEKDE